MNQKHFTSVVKKIYEETDAALKALPKACARGCASCCHQYIKILPVERHPMVEYISRVMPKKIRHQVRRNANSWLDYFNSKTPPDVIYEDDLQKFEKQSAADRVPCPFLIDNSCSIYPVRPLCCRTHIVESSPELCAVDVLRDASRSSLPIFGQSYQALAAADPEYMKTDMDFSPLVYAVADALSVRRVLKRIHNGISRKPL